MSRWPLSGNGICDNYHLLDNCHVRIKGIWVNCRFGTNGIDISVLLGQMELRQLSYWDKWNWDNCHIETTIVLVLMELSQLSLSQLSLCQLSLCQLLWNLLYWLVPISEVFRHIVILVSHCGGKYGAKYHWCPLGGSELLCNILYWIFLSIWNHCILITYETLFQENLKWVILWGSIIQTQIHANSKT